MYFYMAASCEIYHSHTCVKRTDVGIDFSVPSVFRLKQCVIGISQILLVMAISIIVNNNYSSAKYQKFYF